MQKYNKIINNVFSKNININYDIKTYICGLNFTIVKILTKDFTDKLSKILTKEKKILISGHFNPDGDSLGGSLGLFHVLKKAGFDVSVMMPSDLPGFMKWLPGTENIFLYDKNTSLQAINKADIIFYVDFNDESRTEYAAEDLKKSKAVKVMLDHHPQPSEAIDFIFSDTEMSSASEIVFRFIEMMNLKKYLDKDTATCIFTGIMTDTLNFSVNSSRPETFEVISELLKFGINKDEIYDKVNNNFSLKRLKLIGYLLYEKMQIVPEVNFSYMMISKKELKEFNFQDGDHEGIVNMPLSVSDVKISLIAIENDDFIKISLRSKGNYDVNKLSRKYFNGGGHKNAAGGRIYKSYAKTEEYIVTSVKAFFS